MKQGFLTKLLVITSAVAIIISAYLIQASLTKTAKDSLSQSLTRVLNATQQSLSSWQHQEKNTVTLSANDSGILPAIEALLELKRVKGNLIGHSSQNFLRKHFKPLLEAKEYEGYFIIGPDGVNLSSTRNENIGVTNLLSTQKNILYKIFSGKIIISLPQKTDVPLSDTRKDGKNTKATMFSGAPIRDKNDKVIAALVFRINPYKDFTRIINNGRIGISGETYGFNRDSKLISESRFEEQLHELNLISPSSRSILNVEIVNPNLSGSSPPQKTLMASIATSGESGSNLDGYRDYRGVDVVGVWIWDPEMNMGLASEMDLGEAYYSLNISVISIWLVALLAIITIVVLSVKLKRKVAHEKH